MRKYSVHIYIGAVAVVVLLAGAGIYFARSRLQGTQANAFLHTATSTSDISTTTLPIPSVPPTLGITAKTPSAPGTKRYFDSTYHFTLEYPDNLQVSKFPGDNSSEIIAFKDPKTGEGFQIYAVPYDQPKITQQTFDADEPSDVMQSPQNITIDGAPATAFYGQDQAMGDTFEVWFLNGGILYEITTYKSLDSWLVTILESWKFV